MAEYVIGLLKSFRHSERMAGYVAVAADALVKHGGKIVVPPKAPEKIDGDAEAPTAIVVLSFPNATSAHAWRDDPELASVNAMRREGADISFFLIESP